MLETRKIIVILGVTVTSGLSKAIHGLLHFTFDSRLSVFGEIIWNLMLGAPHQRPTMFVLELVINLELCPKSEQKPGSNNM